MKKFYGAVSLCLLAASATAAGPIIDLDQYHSYKTIEATKTSPKYTVFLSSKTCSSEKTDRTWSAAAFFYQNGNSALGCWGKGPRQPDGADMIACKLDENGDLAGNEKVNCVVTQRASFQSTHSLPSK